MVIKKTSSFVNLGIILTSIVVVGLLHFLLLNNYAKKLEYTSNVIKLLNQNKIQLQKTNILFELLESSNNKFQKEVLSSADITEYSFSILISGGKLSGLGGSSIIFMRPNSSELQKLKSLRKIWNEYHSALIQFLKNYDDGVSINIIKTKYKNLQAKQNSTIKFYSNEYEKYKLRSNITNLVSVLFYIFISVILFVFIKNKFLKPIDSLGKAIENITENKPAKELSENSYYKNVLLSLNDLHLKIQERYIFVDQLVKNNYEVDLKQRDKNDLLENSLIQLRNKLKENIEQNAKRLEEEKLRQWFSEGQAKFNDILRESSDTINLLAEASLKNIVKFFNAAQGGFFIIKDADNKKTLELTSSFAYDRIKALNKTIPIGEGLIGMCALEKNTIWINNVPDDYMDIESGLGEAPPTNILIVPLKTEDNILGVIEIASFNEFNKNEVVFIENIAEDIASTLETTKITDKTSVLLEESQKQSEELARRDAEMSEKIAELKELQKQTSKSETEMTSLILAVDKVLFKLELSLTGKISTANKLFLNTLNYSIDDVRGKNFQDIANSKNDSIIKESIQKVRNNESIQVKLNFISKNGDIIKVNSIFSPIKDEKGKTNKVLILAENINVIEDLSKHNSLLITELEEQRQHLLNINTEAQDNIDQFVIKAEKSEEELKKHIDKENKLKEKFETSIDKKYSSWLNSFNS